MSKEKLTYNPTRQGYSSDKSTDIRSSQSEASDTEDVHQANNLSSDNSNSTTRSALLTKSIDLNDDDDNDD